MKLKRFIPYILPYKKQALLNIFFNVLYSLFSALSFIALIPMLDVFFGKNKPVSEPPVYSGSLMDLGGYRNSIIGYYRPNIWANGSTASAPAAPAASSKAVNDQVVADVLRGVYGSGNDRISRLQAAGYNPAEVQAAVNSHVAAQAPRVVAPRQNYAANSTSGYVVRRGDTLGHIALRNGWHGTSGLFGNSGYTQRLAERNGIANRGLIYPGQRINP